MSAEAVLFAYSGLAALALGSQQHRRTMFPRIGMVKPQAARAGGAILIVLSVGAAFARFGVSQGIVASFGLVSAAGLCLVLLLSRWPRGTFMTAPIVAALAFVIAFAGGRGWPA